MNIQQPIRRYQLYVNEMTNDFKRTDRVAQMIQRKLAQIIQTEVKDPRLPRFITVSAVDVSRDLAHAKVYITVLGEHCDKKELLSILNMAASYLRTVLARSIKLRVIPKLHFLYDTSIEYGSHMSQVLNQLNIKEEDDDDDESDSSH